MVCSCLFALTIPTALIPLVDSLWAMVVLRFCQGLAVPGIVVVLIAYLSEEFRSAAVARMTATYVGGTVMGGFCGRFLTGHAGHVLGWRGAFVTLALLNLLGALLVFYALPASRHFVANRDVPGALRVLGRHLGNRRFLAICAVGFCVLFSLVGSFTYVNLYLAQPPFSLSTAGLANVFGVYLLGAVATPLAARYTVRYGFLRAVLASLLLSVGGLLLTLAPHLATVILGLAACSTGVFICQSATIGHIADSVTEGRSLGHRHLLPELLRRRCGRQLDSRAGLRALELGRGSAVHHRVSVAGGGDCAGFFAGAFPLLKPKNQAIQHC